ncbi:hypothetical protein DITRI_Ditri04bG0050700 [Diplodiscus trichospermus]
MERSDKGQASTENPFADWISLFSVVADQALTFFPPRIDNGKPLIAPPKNGEHSLRESGNVDIRPVGTNLFIIQFPNAEMREKVLESGPWRIQNKPLIVRKWEPGLRTLEFNMARLPIWVQLSNGPLELFT